MASAVTPPAGGPPLASPPWCHESRSHTLFTYPHTHTLCVHTPLPIKTGFPADLLLCDPDNQTYAALDFKKGMAETFLSYNVRPLCCAVLYSVVLCCQSRGIALCWLSCTPALGRHWGPECHGLAVAVTALHRAPLHLSIPSPATHELPALQTPLAIWERIKSGKAGDIGSLLPEWTAAQRQDGIWHPPKPDQALQQVLIGEGGARGGTSGNLGR